MTNTKPAHKIIGATVRAANRTYGLRPPQDHGPEETVAEVVNDYNLTIRTVEGNVYSNGNFLLMRYAKEQGSQWRVVPSPYSDGGPLYAVVDEHGKVACDSLDGRLCVFVTRATAEYQLSYLQSRDRLAIG